jgi:hypothetical protein
MNNLIYKINKLLEKFKMTFNDIHKLSHFYIESNNWNKFISIHFDINEKILNSDYISKPIHNLVWNSKNDSKNNINYTENHFIFNSFDVYNNHIQIKKELERLIKNRDKYKEIHFHLDNNGGGESCTSTFNFKMFNR